MLVNTDTIRKYFAKLGLEPEIADIYLSLYSNGPQIISELSRTSMVERTRIYRLIDQLLTSNLIEMEPVSPQAGSKGVRGIIKAAPVSNLRALITEREQETKNLADELELIEKVLSHNSLSNPAVRMQTYEGPEGIRQMLTSELRASSEIVSFEHFSIGEAAGKQYMSGYYAAFKAQKILRRSLGNTPLNTAGEGRVITEEIYPLTHNRTTYDDTTAYYLLNNGRIYGFEIRNKEIADAERRLFELLWEKAEPIR